MNGRVCGALVQFGCYQHRHIEYIKAKALPAYLNYHALLV